MPFVEKPEGPELYDPVVVDALIDGMPVGGASHADWAAAVQRLTSLGYTTKEIQRKLDLMERRVHRLRHVSVAPYPDMMCEYDTGERRSRHLERVADAAMGMVVDMREDPYAPYMALHNMTRQELVEVAMTLACMVDPEATVKSTLGWVNNAMAEVIPIRREA